MSKGDRWISLSFLWYGLKLRIILVYTPNDYLSRRAFWLELQTLLDYDGDVLIIKDFNEVTSPDDRLNSEVTSRLMPNFNSFINCAELIDLPL